MLSDLRFAFRQFFRNPGLTLVIIATLALGIGASTTVLCWIQGILLDPIPGAVNSGDFVAITNTWGSSPDDCSSLPDDRDLATHTDLFSGVIASQVTPACLRADNRADWIYGQIATANFFDVLGVRPLLGRTFLPDEDKAPGGNPVLVISAGLWRRRFNADPSVVGRKVQLNEVMFTIVGVAPHGFKGTMGGLRCDFWAPVSMCQQVANAGSLTSRSMRWLHTQARLAPGVSASQAEAALGPISAQLALAYPRTNRDVRLHAVPLMLAPYGGQALFYPVLRVLLVVSLGVLLIVVVNVANLLLARAVQRQREIAIRLAVGASRLRIMRQLLVESLLLALAGGACGVLFAYWSVGLLSYFIPRTYLPAGYDFPIDGRILASTTGLALAAGLLFGLVPAWQSTRQNLLVSLKDGGKGSSGGPAHHRVRRLLVVSQVSLALVLLVAAALCFQGLRRARDARIGFDPHNLLLAGLRIGMNGYDEASGIRFYGELTRRVDTIPGVKSAALASWFPLGFEGVGGTGVEVPGREHRDGDDTMTNTVIVSAGYFSTMSTPLVEGRDFTPSDDRSAAPVAIVNQTFARHFFPGVDPLGRTFRSFGRNFTVVGVAQDGKYRSVNERPTSFAYFHYAQGVPELNLGLCVRTEGDPSAVGADLQRVIHGLDPRVEIWTEQRMTEFIQASFMAQKIASSLLLVLGLVALGLAALGIYGVMSYFVSQRTQEIGVRVALGAVRTDILGMIVRQGLALAAAGLAVGLLLAALSTRLLSSFLNGVSPFDLATFVGVPLLLGAIAVLSTCLPALRATRIDPLTALRSE